MEKWRLYLILAGIVLVVYNIGNIDFGDLSSSSLAVTGVIASIAFVVMLIAFRKK
ncbi:MAG: hypothetical protein ABFR62_10405 [Bacteroidota bacterium]